MLDHNIQARDLMSIARGRWSFIHSACGVPQELMSGKHRPCPFCGGTDRFRYTNWEDNGGYWCSCGPGDGLKFQQKLFKLSFRQTINQVAQVLGIGRSDAVTRRIVPRQESRGHSVATPDLEAKHYLKWLLANSSPIEPGTPPDLYFKSRGLPLSVYPSALSWYPGLNYRDKDNQLIGKFPVMLAQMKNPSGKVVACLRTYLTENGRKAPVNKPKKLTRSLYKDDKNGAAIQLFEPTNVLGVAEGIETALAAHLRWNIPTWAAFSAGFLEKVVIPDTVKTIYIFADNDSLKTHTGEKAACALARRLIGEGRAAQVIRAREAGRDIADLIIKQEPR